MNDPNTSMFDLARVPFSRYGSYFSVAINDWGDTGPGLYIHSHYSNSPQVCRVELLRDGQPLDYRIYASPSLLCLVADDGAQLEIVLDGDESIRLRGSGLTLRLEVPPQRWTFAYQLPGGAWGVNISKNALQLAVEMLDGTLAMDAPWERGVGFCWESSRIVMTIDADAAASGFELAIDSFVSTWIRPPRPDFDALQHDTVIAFEQWMQGAPAVAPERTRTRDLAAYVNWSATLSPAGNLTRPTMFMSKYSMCNVYHWDHAFNAMAHCRHQPDLAWDQLLVMYDRMDEHGKPPSSMNRHEIRYTISNAPVQGWALRRMWDANPAMFTPERLLEGYDYLSRWSNWLCRHRTFPGDRLPFYHHGFDSGWDNSSIFDQGVPIVTADHAAYLSLQMETVADLAAALGRLDEAADWRRRAAAMQTALLEELWQGDRFVGKRRPGGEIVDCQSLITCMPIVLGRRLPQDVIDALVARIRRHLTPYGLATEHPDSANYLEGGYWRGPIWAPPTMIVATGLMDVGETDLAHTIMQAYCRLCEDDGFFENFSPRTGEGHYCPAYTWTSSVYMIVASQYLNPDRHD